MLDKEEVEAVVKAVHEGEATLADLQDALDDWDGDPFDVIW